MCGSNLKISSVYVKNYCNKALELGRCCIFNKDNATFILGIDYTNCSLNGTSFQTNLYHDYRPHIEIMTYYYTSIYSTVLKNFLLITLLKRDLTGTNLNDDCNRSESYAGFVRLQEL